MTAARIDRQFAKLGAARRAGLVAYVMAGDPDLAASLKIMQAMVAAGADMIELGLPFSDPMADGPIIQRGALRALASGTTTRGVLELVAQFRESDAETPIVLMGYLNPVLTLGSRTFARLAAAAGADGVIMVDCPPEEAEALTDDLEAEGLALIRLATPTTDSERLTVVARRTRGFVYYVAVAGVTGDKAADAASVAPAVARVRAASGLPVAVGFGVREAAQAAAIARVADAVVVGSALVGAVGEAAGAGRSPADAAALVVSALAQAVRSARQEPYLG